MDLSMKVLVTLVSLTWFAAAHPHPPSNIRWICVGVNENPLPYRCDNRCPKDCNYHPMSHGRCRSSCPTTVAPLTSGNTGSTGSTANPFPPLFCDCASGYVRHEGACIEQRDCPQYGCSVNETLLMGECYPHCDRLCGETERQWKNRCPSICDSMQCVCKQGYAKVNEESEKCIQVEDCPNSMQVLSTLQSS